jgi:serine acetyltransferase
MDSVKKRCKAKVNTKKKNKLLEKAKKSADNIVSGAKYLKKAIKEDVAAVRERDPAARSDAEVLLLYSGVHALIAHRVAHGLHGKGHYFAARAISQTAKMITGIEIHPGATIGKGLVIETVIILENVDIIVAVNRKVNRRI